MLEMVVSGSQIELVNLLDSLAHNGAHGGECSGSVEGNSHFDRGVCLFCVLFIIILRESAINRSENHSHFQH